MSKSGEKVLEVKGWKNIEWKVRGEVVKREDFEVPLAVVAFATEPAKVMREYGLTINLGNYESAKVTVGIALPCYREEIDTANELAKKFCESEIQAECSEIKGSKNGSKKSPI